MKILIIDDEPLIRMSLVRIFKARGHEVFEARDGVEGLSAWKTNAPDLVLLDWIMPNKNGHQLLLNAKELTLKSIVYVMSAYTNETNEQVLKDLGVVSFIPKPFDNVLEIVKQVEDSFVGRN